MDDNVSITPFLMGVARDAIEHCVAKEGGNPAIYDYETDPKGYVASFVSALRHWCLFHGLDWEMEIAWAEEFFREDLCQTGGKSLLSVRPVLKEWPCPFCGCCDNPSNLKVEQENENLPELTPNEAGTQVDAISTITLHLGKAPRYALPPKPMK
jgi:hypothetical protein